MIREETNPFGWRPPVQEGQPKRVLLVEDEPATLRFYQTGLKGLTGWRQLSAVNGEKALEILRKEPIDVLVTDINMPVMDGVQMVEEMDRRGLVRDIPVVIVSTDRSEVRMQQLKQHGVKEYLNKPFTPESIRDILAACLKERSPGGTPGA